MAARHTPQQLCRGVRSGTIYRSSGRVSYGFAYLARGWFYRPFVRDVFPESSLEARVVAPQKTLGNAMHLVGLQKLSRG